MKVDSIPGMLLDRARHILIPRIVVSRKDYDIQDEEGRLFETKTPWQHGVPQTVLREVTPQEILEESQKILRRLRHMPEPTVGDLSGLKNDRRTLQQLFYKQEDHRNLSQLYEHAAPSWLPISESQRLLKESQKKRQDEKETAFLIKQIMFRRQIEKEIMRENARRHLAL